MFAQQQTMAQLLELLQRAREALLEAVRDRVTTRVVNDMHHDEDVRRRAILGDKCGDRGGGVRREGGRGWLREGPKEGGVTLDGPPKLEVFPPRPSIDALFA